LANVNEGILGASLLLRKEGFEDFRNAPGSWQARQTAYSD